MNQIHVHHMAWYMLGCHIMCNLLWQIMCQMALKKFSYAFSTVWWAFVSGRSSSVDVWSHMDSRQPDSLWRAFWEQSACQQIQHKDKAQRPPPTTTNKKEREMKRFMSRRKISYCLSFWTMIYQVHGLSEAMARQDWKTDEMWTWICHYVSNWNVKCMCGITATFKYLTFSILTYNRSV